MKLILPSSLPAQEQGQRKGAHNSRKGELAFIMSTTSRPTLEVIRAHKGEILRIAATYGARNVRIFGSVA